MGRRTVLLVVAVLVAALGSAMVFLYVKTADTRAVADQAPVQVLEATAQINPGETLASAQAAGKLHLATVPRAQVITGAVDTVETLGSDVALSTVYPGEQIITAKFGSAGSQDVLPMPKGDVAVSVNPSDTGRVAGFVAPGAQVAVFVSYQTDGGPQETRLLLPRVKVIAVGATTVTSSTSGTDGTQDTAATDPASEQLFTVAASQQEAEKLTFAAKYGELSFALLNARSKVNPGPAVDSTNLFR